MYIVNQKISNVILRLFIYLYVVGVGKINEERFVNINQAAILAPFYKEDTHAELTEALKCFDKNKDGIIPKVEMKAILPDYDDDILEEVFDAADNGDGNLLVAG